MNNAFTDRTNTLIVRKVKADVSRYCDCKLRTYGGKREGRGGGENDNVISRFYVMQHAGKNMAICTGPTPGRNLFVYSRSLRLHARQPWHVRASENCVTASNRMYSVYLLRIPIYPAETHVRSKRYLLLIIVTARQIVEEKLPFCLLNWNHTYFQLRKMT